jgi:hypothetical protein
VRQSKFFCNIFFIFYFHPASIAFLLIKNSCETVMIYVQFSILFYSKLLSSLLYFCGVTAQSTLDTACPKTFERTSSDTDQKISNVWKAFSLSSWEIFRNTSILIEVEKCFFKFFVKLFHK